jgi:MHS family proline/betaine transporter-like MFS transporter
MVEQSRPRHRAFGASWLQFAGIVGFLLGSGVDVVISQGVSDQAMSDWGWRVPFLVAGPLGFIGIYIRVRLSESIEFQEAENRRTTSGKPIRQLLAAPRRLLTAIGLSAFQLGSFYLIAAYMNVHLRGAGLRLRPRTALHVRSDRDDSRPHSDLEPGCPTASAGVR